MGWLRKNPRIESEAAVAAALDAWRPGSGRPGEGFSPAARAEMFRRVTEGGPEVASTSTLFPPVRRWVLACGIPLVLTLGLAWLGQRTGEPARVQIRAAKQGEDVVFTIADGRGVHRVVRSESPTQFDTEIAVRVRNGGSFRDNAETGGDLVFYRID